MAEEIKSNDENSNVKSTIDAVTGLAKAIPVYNDAIQPAAKEVGKSLVVVAKTINIALSPISALVWGYDKIKDFIQTRISEKLENVAEEKIVTPDPAVVGPSLEALRFSGNDINLRELYASLIATAMNSDKIKNAHPGFVEIIKNLSSDEALLLNFLKTNDQHAVIDLKWTHPNIRGEHDLLRNVSLVGQRINIPNPQFIPNYIDNLCRLGLLEIPPGRQLMDDALYNEIIEQDYIKKIKKTQEDSGGSIVVLKKYIKLTGFGKQFCIACVSL